MKKVFAGWLSAVLVLSAFVPPMAANETGASATQQANQLEVSRSVFSLTEARTVEVSADLGEGVDLEDVEFQFGGKPLSEWQQWTQGQSYNGDPFITVVEEPSFVEGTNQITAVLEFGLLYGTDDLSNRTIRTQYQQFIGDYELALVDSASGEKAAATVELNVYDEFKFYDELKPAIDEIFEAAEEDENNDRYLEYQTVGKTTEGRDIHFVILARDEEAVDQYLNETLPTALEDPESLIEKLENDTMGDYQVPIWFNNIHPDEVEGVDVQVELLEKFALEDEVEFMNTDGDTEFEENLNVDEVLDDAIFLYMFTSNPDGRAANTRANAEGFDLNRDNAYQTQVETQQVNEVLSKWTPLSFVDFHGYVDGFLIEPATPPHNPNFEYDLLIDNMMEQANAMGNAGIANSELTSYFIAKDGYGSGWDDMTPAYTAIYAMLHGSLGHTIEVPKLGQDGYNALVGSGLGAANYVHDNKDRLYKEQLEIFKRGVDGEDNRAVDEYYVNAAGEVIGRDRGDNENFFPDYYVIPTDDKNQKNALEAYKMADYLIRNGVEVEKTVKPVKADGVTYPKGTFIVPMDQAKRGLANAMLYEGDDVSDWDAMYDPIVVNFSDLRGFDLEEVRVENAFDGKTQELEEAVVPTSTVKGNPPKQILENSTNDAIRVVNALLADGKTVEVLTESKGKAEAGDFVVATNDLRPYADDYYFETQVFGNGKNADTEMLEQPSVAATGSAQLDFSLRELGFELTDAAEADVIVSDSGSFNAAQVSGKTFVGIGAPALNAVSKSGLLPGFAYASTGSRHEGLVKANVAEHPLTAGYEEQENLYVTTGSWISGVPEGAEVLASFQDSDDFYLAGWWPGYEQALGQTMAITAEQGETKFNLFANSLAFRAHTEHSYRFIANSIYDAVSVEAEVVEKGKGKKK
ncbi:M14 family metallopeptidase [Planococcus maritimus]|uniref:M14 family metallopeptidase n=1 Tax=Planococcus maritimus TaxID=192421 RepID=UPI0007928E02|nr:M14 family zinc carboxypeptidase [Planococcus maritimus]KYG58453.1 X-prolyl-dipeptidyl aminopeptidase [Planococcus maritimus]